MFSAAIRDYSESGTLRAVTVGETTYAKGIMQSTFMLSDGSALTLTTAYYNPPSNVNYDGTGVSPDFEVSEASGTDAPLAKAYTEMHNLINSSK